MNERERARKNDSKEIETETMKSGNGERRESRERQGGGDSLKDLLSFDHYSKLCTRMLL